MFFSFKSGILICTLIIIAIYLCVNISIALSEYAKTGADWVSALIQTLGNISGGIIGGIVAYIVAKYQIDKQIKIQMDNNFKSTIFKLKLIKEELLDNKSIIKTMLGNTEDDECQKVIASLSKNTWEGCLSNISLSDNLLIKLNKAYKRIMIFATYDAKDLSDEMLSKAINLIDSAVSEIDEFNADNS